MSPASNKPWPRLPGEARPDLTAWFNDILVIGTRPPCEVAALLCDIDETEITDNLAQAPKRGIPPMSAALRDVG